MSTFVTQPLTTQAGHQIIARHYPSSANGRKRLVVIAPATGVAQYHYQDFAEWLANRGFDVLTFDYEGTGLSINGNVKNSTSDLLSWAEQDGMAVLNHAREYFSQHECLWIGHSVGGHLLGMMPQTHPISRAITVAAGTGTWWYNAAPTKRVVWFLWFFLVPLSVPLFGYFPGSKLGVMCDLPKGVILQWRRWCMKEDYAVEFEGDWLRERFARVSLPITAIEFSDDDMMSAKSLDKLHGFFSQCDIQRQRVKPSDIGVKRIGHIGWSKHKYHAMWEKVFLPLLDG